MSQPAKLSEVMDYLNPKDADGKRVQGVKQFTDEWKELTEQDQEQIKAGIGNGSYNY